MKNNIALLALIVVFLSCNSKEMAKEITSDVVVEVEDETEETAKNVIWKNWYLSVPLASVDGSGKATSIFYEAIENNNLTEEQKEYFYQNSDESYTMYTKFTGYTTSGTYAVDQKKYSRTELREYWQGNQDIFDNWYMDSGTHEMETTLKVNSCGGNGQTYVAQIHAKGSPTKQGSPATVKVQWNNGGLVIEYYVQPDTGIWTSDFGEKITIGTVDNEKFTIKLGVAAGKLYYGLFCEAKNINITYQVLYDYSDTGYDFDNYFKTGNYFKWDGDMMEDAEVVLYGVKTLHE